jgi:dolichol-phosphate mannosyltransferase
VTPERVAHRCARDGESGSEPDVDLTIVVPTRNERDNVGPLLRRLDGLSPELRFAVIFVDDSSDDTARVVQDEAAACSRWVSVLHRPEAQRPGGLGGAVKLGLLSARSDLICVMDADLQHPPEVLEALLAEARNSNADVVVASRYCARGDVGEFSPFRVALSRGSSMVAKAVFPRRLRAVSDPMSGFFLVRRSALNVHALRPEGFKVLLEILLSRPGVTTSEVPFRFGERHSGDSKASLREGARYLRRLVELRTRRRATWATDRVLAPRYRVKTS